MKHRTAVPDFSSAGVLTACIHTAFDSGVYDATVRVCHAQGAQGTACAAGVCMGVLRGAGDPVPLRVLAWPLHPPNITSVRPASGPIEGGTILTLAGTNFFPSEGIRYTLCDDICAELAPSVGQKMKPRMSSAQVHFWRSAHPRGIRLAQAGSATIGQQSRCRCHLSYTSGFCCWCNGRNIALWVLARCWHRQQRQQ